MNANTGSDLFNADKCYAFARRKDKELLVIIANFCDTKLHTAVCLPRHFFEFFQIEEKEEVIAQDLLDNAQECVAFNSSHPLLSDVPAYGGKILRIRL